MVLMVENGITLDEIKAELNLTETTKQIIKEDPQYFEAIIQNVLK